jgi:crossover junction endodeoxyribonuclease RuvC
MQRGGAVSERTRRVLGIDTALRSTGLAVVETEGSRMRAAETARIRNATDVPLSECLVRLDRSLADVLEQCEPTAVAVETAFFHRNARTAMILGHARGVALAACAKRSIPLYEYEPRRVKQATVGYGAASKEQVRAMVRSLLNLESVPQEDIADALALAICHLHNCTAHTALMPKRI